jgi:hypothetical protein
MAKSRYDPHKKYVRVGECRRCGRCCDLHCPSLKWVANRDVKKDEVFTDTGIDGPFMAICTADPKPQMCADFPTDPWQTPPKCGYSWKEATE